MEGGTKSQVKGAPPRSGWARMVVELDVNDLGRSLSFWRDVLGFQTAFERAEERFAYLEHPEGHQIMLCQTAATKASRVEEWWGAGKARLLVVVGLQDVVAPPENGRLIKDEFGDRVTLQEIDGAGHAMLPERPKQVAAAVLNFLKPQSK